MVLPTDSIAGPVYPYDTTQAPLGSTLFSFSSRPLHMFPLPTQPSVHPSFLPSIRSCHHQCLNSCPRGALLLELAVVVVAGVGPGDVVAVPMQR